MRLIDDPSHVCGERRSPELLAKRRAQRCARRRELAAERAARAAADNARMAEEHEARVAQIVEHARAGGKLLCWWAGYFVEDCLDAVTVTADELRRVPSTREVIRAHRPGQCGLSPSTVYHATIAIDDPADCGSSITLLAARRVAPDLFGA